MMQIAFLTGRSDKRRCALSPEQEAFLAQLAAPGRRLLPRNFPYAADSPPHRPTPLWRASLANFAEYRAARRPQFAVCHGEAMRAVLARAPQTVLLAGSCGLELLAGLALDGSSLSRLAVFAYGAVARVRPNCEAVLVQGRRDRLARWFGPRADHLVDAGHLDYLRAPEVLALCRAFLARVEARA